MHELVFLQDLALVMCVAGLVTVLFHRFKQPVVLGYILAGVILGPHTPSYVFISDEQTIKTLSSLGIIFLLFALGLEFSLRKLKRVGLTAVIAVSIEIPLMAAMGYGIGTLFNWGLMNSIFLGAIMSISSTTIIAKALEELGRKKEKFTDLVFGILIFEDMVAIIMLALLSGFAVTGSLEPTHFAITMGKMVVFLVSVLIAGLLFIPRLLNYVARFNSNEMLLVTVLGLCFGISLLTVKLGYSVALGAFLVGAIIAESRHIVTIESLVQPVRDMFSAVFFVSIGLLIDPHMIVQYWVPIVVIALGVSLGKIIACSSGAFLAGNNVRSSLYVGMSLAQIGEFSFIIAALGLALKVTDGFIYPIAVAVSAITTFLTPYLIKNSGRVVKWLERAVPPGLLANLDLYTQWVEEFRRAEQDISAFQIIKQIAWKVALNLALVAAIFISAAFIFQNRLLPSLNIAGQETGLKSMLWFGAMLISLPILIAVFRKIRALSMLLAEMSMPAIHDERGDSLRSAASTVILVACSLILLLLLLLVSSAILPPVNQLIGLSIVVAIIAFVLRHTFGRLHHKAQIALAETFDVSHENNQAPISGDLAGTRLEMIELGENSGVAGKLISELKVRSLTGASIIAIQRGSQAIISPKADEELEQGDQILLLGKADELLLARNLIK